MLRCYNANEDTNKGDDFMSKWKIAIYLRLSKDDGDKDESDSISSQRSMITSYINTLKVELGFSFRI